jgi:predicted nucleotidyltransferase
LKNADNVLWIAVTNFISFHLSIIFYAFAAQKFGKFRYSYYLCQQIAEITCTIMLDKTKTIETLKSTRQYLDEHYGVRSMLLFGSLARDEQHEDSDVDVCVDMVPNLFNRAGVKVYLEELLGCHVDVVRMRENMNPVFKQQIQKYGIRVY